MRCPHISGLDVRIRVSGLGSCSLPAWQDMARHRHFARCLLGVHGGLCKDTQYGPICKVPLTLHLGRLDSDHFYISSSISITVYVTSYAPTCFHSAGVGFRIMENQLQEEHAKSNGHGGLGLRFRIRRDNYGKALHS